MNFTFTNKFVWLLFWGLLILIISSDIYSLLKINAAQIQLSLFMKSALVLGAVLKLSILACLILRKGPIRELISVWSMLLMLSGVFGLLALAVSENIEPIQAYIDKAIFLSIGIILIVIASKFITDGNEQKN